MVKLKRRERKVIVGDLGRLENVTLAFSDVLRSLTMLTAVFLDKDIRIERKLSYARTLVEEISKAKMFLDGLEKLARQRLKELEG